MACGCRNKSAASQQAVEAQKKAEARRAVIREERAKTQAKANTAK
jgi:hypothetical protein